MLFSAAVMLVVIGLGCLVFGAMMCWAAAVRLREMRFGIYHPVGSLAGLSVGVMLVGVSMVAAGMGLSFDRLLPLFG